MKKLLALAAMALAGCAQEKTSVPDEHPVPAGYEVLATFTMQVDPAAGTVNVVQDSPPAQSGARTTRAVSDISSGVSLANATNSYWYNVQKACPVADALTWGATVNMTSNLASSEESYAGVFAEIDSYAGAPALSRMCSTTTDAPPDLDNRYGLFSYGSLTNSVAKGVEWRFKYVSSAYFTVRGRILGMKVTRKSMTGHHPTRAPLALYGTSNIAYGDMTTRTIALIDSSGAIQSSSPAFSGSKAAYTLVSDATRVWFTTTKDSGDSFSSVGFWTVGSPGTLSEWSYPSVAADLSSSVLDPAGGKLWFIAGPGIPKILNVDTSGAISQWDIIFPGGGYDVPGGLVFGPDPVAGYIFVTVPARNVILALPKDTPFYEYGESAPVPSACSAPKQIILGPDGLLWFYGQSGTTYGVCTFHPTTGAFNTVLTTTVAPPSQFPLCVGPGPNTWWLLQGDSTVNYVKLNAGPSTSAKVNSWSARLSADVGMNPWGCAGNDTTGLWVSSSTVDGPLFKVTP